MHSPVKIKILFYYMVEAIFWAIITRAISLFTLPGNRAHKYFRFSATIIAYLIQEKQTSVSIKTWLLILGKRKRITFPRVNNLVDIDPSSIIPILLLSDYFLFFTEKFVNMTVHSQYINMKRRFVIYFYSYQC